MTIILAFVYKGFFSYFLQFSLFISVLFVTYFMTGHKNALIVKWNVTTDQHFTLFQCRNTASLSKCWFFPPKRMRKGNKDKDKKLRFR